MFSDPSIGTGGNSSLHLNLGANFGPEDMFVSGQNPHKGMYLVSAYITPAGSAAGVGNPIASVTWDDGGNGPQTQVLADTIDHPSAQYQGKGGSAVIYLPGNKMPTIAITGVTVPGPLNYDFRWSIQPLLLR